MTWQPPRSARSSQPQVHDAFLASVVFMCAHSTMHPRIGADTRLPPPARHAHAADMSAAFKAWAAESHAFAANTSYAPELLDALGDGRGTQTHA